MGGYGGYVWSAYGITLVVLIWIAVSPIIRRRQLMKALRRRQRRQSARQA
jgi:heme exporter protein D